MKFEDAVETYYFVKSKKKQIKKYIDDFPMIFTAEKKIPLNFQMKMAELSDGNTRRRSSDKRFRLSMQTRITKIELRRNIMKLVLKNRDSNKVFEFLDESEDEGVPIWFYISDNEDKLEGPFGNEEMQKLFQNGKLKATTQVKKKLMPEFVQMRYLLNKFCRLRAIESIDEGKFYEHLAQTSPTKTFKIDENVLEEWLAVIGKKIDLDPHNYTNNMSSDMTSNNTDSFSYRKERLSFVLSKQGYQDKQSHEASSNPFEGLNVKKGDQNERKSFTRANGEDKDAKGFNKRRGRYSTANFKPQR